MANEGIVLATAQQRQMFMEEYGAWMLFALLQPKCMFHRCMEYCLKERRQEDGTTVMVRLCPSVLAQ